MKKCPSCSSLATTNRLEPAEEGNNASDDASMENHTNAYDQAEYTIVNESQQVLCFRGEPGEQPSEEAARPIYEQSIFMVETLQQEFCRPLGDGWMEFKEPVPLETINATPPVEQKGGRWSKDEHALFLEALRIFGKDWDQIQRHVGSRNVKNIRAHAQKFLLKLVKILETNSDLADLSVDEASFFFGILNKKGLHNSTLARIRKSEQERPKLFQVTKVPRDSRQTSDGKEFQQAELAQEKREEFDLWRETESVTKSCKSFGFSLQAHQRAIQANSDFLKYCHQTHCKFSFKSIIKPNIEEDDGDSAESFSTRHFLKYDINDSDYPTDIAEQLTGSHAEANEAMEAFGVKIMASLEEIGDLPSSDFLPILKMGAGGPRFNLLQQYEKRTFLADAYFINQKGVPARFPQLAGLMTKGLNMHFEGSCDFADIDNYLNSFLTTPEGRARLKNIEAVIEFSPRQEWEGISMRVPRNEFR